MKPKTPITLVTGFLGSGKTTLLRKILADTNQRVAVVMNEFGEIAVDSKVVTGKNVQMAELAGGCVCCSLTGEFEAAVKEILETAQPDSIIVETTGVAEPDALILQVQDGLAAVRLEGVIVLADAHGMINFPQLGRTARMQLEAGDIIIINKLDLVSPDELRRVEAQIRQLNRRALVVHAVYCDIDTKFLFGLNVETRALERGHTHQMEFEAVSFSSGRLISKTRFETVLNNLPPQIYRAKGFIVFDEGSYLFNYVAGRWDLEEHQANKTELVFIGKQLAPIKDTIIAQFQGCEVTHGI